MPTLYNRIAGTQLERIAALSDGLFAIAMTLIVLEIHVPSRETIATDGELWTALTHLGPRIATYLLSFMTLGIFWVGQQAQLHAFDRGDRHLSWLHLAFLAAVATMPFSTGLLAEFTTFRLALIIYWANILLLGVLLYVSWVYAERAGLVRDDMPADTGHAIRRRIVVAQSLYFVGMLLCFVHPYWSIGFIVLVQLNYAVAPRLPWGTAAVSR